MAPKLGIIAGGGDLPKLIVEACRADGRAFFVLAIEEQTEPETVADAPHAWVRLGAAGKALQLCKREGVREIVMAGPVRRPSLSGIRPDWRALRFLLRLGRRGLGDDGLLRRIIAEIESEGFHIIGADEILTDLRPARGPLGCHRPTEDAMHDIERGLSVLRALSTADVGQAVVVQDGVVLGVEAIEGTDALLDRCGPLARDAPGGVLVKIRKHEQEERVDLPTIGPETVRRAASAGLRGIAIEAEGALVIDRGEVVRLANEMGLFVVAVVTGDCDDE